MTDSLPRKGRIVRRFVVAVILFSSAITLITTGTQLYLDYRRDVDTLRTALSSAEAAVLPGLVAAVGDGNEGGIASALEMLLAHPDVARVALSIDGDGGYQRGIATVQRPLRRTTALTGLEESGVTADLEITASVQPIIDRLIDRTVVILVGNGIKTFLVAGFILLLFHLLVTRHLGALARYARELSVADSTEPISLQRPSKTSPDELDELAEAISGMASRVSSAYHLLRESEQRFRDFAEASSDWYWETGPDLRMTYISDGYSKTTVADASVYIGRRREEFPGLIIDPNRLAEHLLVMERRLPFRDFVYARRTSGGEVRHFQTSGRPCWNGQGKFLGYRGVARDITATFKANEAQQRTELQLARAIEAIPAACALFDEDDRLIICNKTYRKLFERIGREVSENATYDDLVRSYAEAGGIPGTKEEVDAWLARRLKRRQRPERNFEYLRADGHWAEVSDYVLDDGRILHFAADVTARKRAEERAQAERAKAAEYLQVAQTIIVALNRDGGVELLNRYGCEQLGYRLDEVLGKDWFDMVIPPDLCEDLRAGFTASIAGDKPLQEYAEHDVVTKRGELRRIAWRNGAIRDEQGNIQTTLSSGLDITEHMAAEEALLQAQKMDAIGKLTGGIAHDFNNLLAIVLGNLDLILERLPDGSDLTRLAQPAISAAERGAELTARLLAFSRKQPLQPKIVNLNDLIENMTELLRRSLGETIAVRVDLSDGIWPCEVDPVQMESAILNLAVNARDAMPGGGHLTIETVNERLDRDYVAKNPEVVPGDYVLLAVSDDGTGMSADVLERVFEPFFTTKQMGEGTGLGLSITYGFVKQSGGHVNIYSEPGQGSTVRIYLPRAKKAKQVDVPGAGRDKVPLGDGQQVLVVEDDPDVRDLAVRLLDELGYHTLEAGDGRAALNMLDDADGISLLMTDVVLPGGMAGDQLAEKIKELKPSVGVLYMSGYSESAILHHGKLDAGVHLLQKPFRKSELARKVNEALHAARE